MAALTTLNITEKNTNNSLSVTVKVNVTKEGVFTTTLSKEDVDKIHSYKIKLPVNRLGNECTSKLFVDMIKSICKISEQIKSFINPEQIKAIAESNEPILLLSNN